MSLSLYRFSSNYLKLSPSNTSYLFYCSVVNKFFFYWFYICLTLLYSFLYTYFFTVSMFVAFFTDHMSSFLHLHIHIFISILHIYFISIHSSASYVFIQSWKAFLVSTSFLSFSFVILVFASLFFLHHIYFI